MDLIDRLRNLSTQIPKLKERGLIKTEEGTKNALVMPFITALGYDVFDPTEVTPELVADVGTKKGEKVDYAILRDGKPIILFECKAVGTDLDNVVASQLYRYFSVTEARFGVLTDGVIYHFYTDLDAPNKMDSKPFLVVDLLELKDKDQMVEELKKFAKAAFDIDRIISTASELKYTSAIKKIIVSQLSQPSEEFVRLFASQVYAGRMTQNALAQFTEITKRAWREVINERMTETFDSFKKATLASESETNTPTEQTSSSTGSMPENVSENGVVTTPDEQYGYLIVQAIVCEVIDISRVKMRDAKSYCAILCDDNNRRPICRLYFNTSQKYLGVFKADKTEERVRLDRVEDIYKYGEQLRAAAQQYV